MLPHGPPARVDRVATAILALAKQERISPMLASSPSLAAPVAATPRKGLVVLIAVIAALGGLLFGYDTGIIGVALLGLGREFAMDDTVKQLVTGAIIFGALFGCLGTGPISDRLGRRKTIIGVPWCSPWARCFRHCRPTSPC